MKAIPALQELIRIPDETARQEAFRDWLDKYVEQLGCLAALDDELMARVEDATHVQRLVVHKQAGDLAWELMQRPGVVRHETKVQLFHNRTDHLAMLTVIRDVPRGELAPALTGPGPIKPPLVVPI